MGVGSGHGADDRRNTDARHVLEYAAVVRPPLLGLFDAYRTGRTDFRLASLALPRVAWAMEMGLGPLLARTCRDDPAAAAFADWDAIRGADLAARVVMEDQAEATVELIEASTPLVGPLTLLKGIWLSHALYPEPHLRPMRDVDVMVQPEAVPEVEAVLLRLGYEQRPEGSPDHYRSHHHAAPFRHPGTGVWVEVHRRLLPARPYGSDAVFEPGNVRAHLRPDLFRGLRVHRLADELQVLYLAAHWAGSLKAVSGAGGLLVLLDLMGLLPAVKWDEVIGTLPRTEVASALLLLVTYLQTRGMQALEPEVMDAVWRSQSSFGRANLAFLHLLMDRRLADGGSYGRWVRSRRNLEIVWTTLLRRRSPLHNLLALAWGLVPKGGRLAPARGPGGGSC